MFGRSAIYNLIVVSCQNQGPRVCRPQPLQEVVPPPRFNTSPLLEIPLTGLTARQNMFSNKNASMADIT